MVWTIIRTVLAVAGVAFSTDRWSKVDSSCVAWLQGASRPSVAFDVADRGLEQRPS